MIRSSLRKLIFEAWKASLDKDYQNQRINSERSLQASFWGQLNIRLNNETMSIFVEPTFLFKLNAKLNRVCPDLVICNTRTIVGVVELKYQPRVTPSVDKDLRTLESLAKYRENLSLVNKRYRGLSTKKREYQFSDKTIYVWAGVHKLDSKGGSLASAPPLAEGLKALHGNYLELHAETDFDRAPNIYKKNY